MPSQISADQEHWLENAINPFPDYPTEPQRLPSKTAVSTAVKTVQKLINISAPTVGTPAATWTANVFLLPVDAVNDPSSIFRGVAVTKTLLQSPTPFANPGTYGLLMVCKAWDVTGTEPANPFSSTFNPANAEFESITLGDAWNGEGSARLTSCGYEIVDNTAQLYKGGNMVNWRKTSKTSLRVFSSWNPRRILTQDTGRHLW